MADNILDLDAACQRESPQAAKRMRLDTDHAGPAAQEACSSPPCPLGGADIVLQEEDSSVRIGPWVGERDKIVKGLDRLRLERTLCDVILCCEGQDLPCHRAVLASFSPFFEAMFTSGTEESTQDRVTIREESQMIALLVNYAYTYNVSFCADNAQALLETSDLLEIAAVREACCEYMKDIKRWENREAKDLPPASWKWSIGGFTPLIIDPPPPEIKNYWDPHHPRKLLEGLNRLRLNSVLCDVILCCVGQEVPCHRAVLASFSPYFEAMFTSGMRESTQDRVTINGVDPHTIGVLVNYAYTGEVCTTKAHMQALLVASVMFDVTAVRIVCCKYMTAHVDMHNCVEMYCFAEAHSCECLQTKSMHYIEEHFRVIYQQEEFLSLSVERLTEVLSSELNVPEEDMVFEAAMLWLDKCPTRKQSFGQVLEHIRLPLLSPSYLHTVVLCLDVVKEQQGCQRFISEAKGEQPYSNTARPRRTTVIVAVGENLKKEGVNTLKSFDPPTKEWRTVKDFSKKTDSPAMVASGSTLYLAGGNERRGHRGRVVRCGAMWSFDVRNKKWMKMASMKEGRARFSLVMLDGYVFAVGGSGRGYMKCTMERYDPSADTWELMKDTGAGAHYDVRSCDVVALDGHLYFIGGIVGAKDEGPGGQVAKYNPKTSVWTQLAPMQFPRNDSAACVLNGKIYVTGGLCEHGDYACKGITETVECYNPQTDRWTMCAPILGRYKHSAVVDNGNIYVLGGTEKSTNFSVIYDDYDDYFRHARTIECYCEETDTWEEVGEMPAARGIRCVSLKLPRYHGYDVQSRDDDAQYSPSGDAMNDEW